MVFKVTHVVMPNDHAALSGFPGALTEEGVRVLDDDGTTILDEVTTEIISLGKWRNYQRTKKAQTLMRKLNEDEEKTG